MIFEEEDFQISNYGYSLFPSIPDQKLLEIIKEAEEELIKKSEGGTSSEEELGIINRLKFLRLLLRSLINLWANDNVWPTETEINETVKLLNGASELMPIIKKTVEKGTQADENCDLKIIYL